MPDEPVYLTPFKMFEKAQYRLGDPAPAEKPDDGGLPVTEPGELRHPSQMGRSDDVGLAGTASVGNVEPTPFKTVDPLTGGLPSDVLDTLTTVIGGVAYRIAHLKGAGVNYNVTPEAVLITEADASPEKAVQIQAKLEAQYPRS